MNQVPPPNVSAGATFLNRRPATGRAEAFVTRSAVQAKGRRGIRAQPRAFPVAPGCACYLGSRRGPPASSDGFERGSSGSSNQSQPLSVASPGPECSPTLLWTPHHTSRGCRRAAASFVLMKLFLGEMTDSFPVSVPGGQSAENQPKFPRQP